ncbi:unnamed protein product [Spirodela intermedia]|uniref:Uncharacterized protein n=1 Tax=Spirodela intermedia TaxID=51605 RepID=A0A7I8LLY9_SPIIN|nr:unnamed protein product [Spirodela intermedia]
MFTPQPQRRGWSLTPRAAEKNGSTPSQGRSAGGGFMGKGKGVAISEAPPPPRASLDENGTEVSEEGRDAAVWKRFQEAGLLDQASLEKKDREALIQRISKLETELYEYQYNMGLLLIEKKEWTSKYEDLRQGLAETGEILKREQTAHMIALSEVQKREDNLNRALGVEKQCVSDLEKALSEMRGECAKVKFTSDQKLAEAHGMMTSIEEKSLEVDAKLRAADAKFAEASRKSSEIERKLLDVTTRESIAQRELASLNAEKQLMKEDLDRQREDLRTWEKNLREGQERLVASQSLLNQREKRSNEHDVALKKKEKELEAMRETIERSNLLLKEKEDDMSSRLSALAAREKEIDIKMEDLEKKEKDLIALEDQLNAREKVEMQKLLDDHAASLDSKKHEFELEMEKRRSLVDEELKEKLDSVEKKAKEVSMKEEKVAKREQTVEKKTEKLKEEKADLDVKSKALKKWEAAIKADEKNLDKQSKQLAEDTQQLLLSKSELEAEKAAVDEEKQSILTEKENLKVTEAEREEHTLLQARLKQEIDEYIALKGSLENEREDLRQERERFEKEWDVLDEKRASMAADLKQFNDERMFFEKWRVVEEERLSNEHQAARDLVQKDLDDLNLKKEDFERTILHERSELREMLEKEQADAARALDLQKHELEINMQNKFGEMEEDFRRKVAAFEAEREKELENIRLLRENVVSEMQKLSAEQRRFDREKQELNEQGRKLEEERAEIRNDVEALHALSKSLKSQREDFVRERDNFLALVEEYKARKDSGAAITEFAPSEIEDPGSLLLPSLAEGYLDERLKGKKAEASSPPAGSSPSATSGGRMSWLRSCTKIFSFSPVKRIEDEAGSSHEAAAPPSKVEDEAEPSDAERVESEGQVRMEEEALEELDGAGKEPEPSLLRDEADGGRKEAESEAVILPVGGQEEVQVKPHRVTKRKVGRPAKKGRPAMKKTRSVQAVVEDAKASLKEASSDRAGPSNGDVNDDGTALHDIDESQGDSVHTDGRANVGQKRRLHQTSETTVGEPDGEGSEARSESISLDGRRKRRQMAVPEAQTPGDKRYNFRRSTVANTVASTQAVLGTKVVAARPLSLDGEVSRGESEKEGTDKSQSQKPVSIQSREFYEEIQEEAAAVEEEDVGEEVTGMLVEGGSEELGTASSSSDEVGSSDSEEGHGGDASIRRRLWKFFTS